MLKSVLVLQLLLQLRNFPLSLLQLLAQLLAQLLLGVLLLLQQSHLLTQPARQLGPLATHLSHEQGSHPYRFQAPASELLSMELSSER